MPTYEDLINKNKKKIIKGVRPDQLIGQPKAIDLANINAKSEEVLSQDCPKTVLGQNSDSVLRQSQDSPRTVLEESYISPKTGLKTNQQETESTKTILSQDCPKTVLGQNSDSVLRQSQDLPSTDTTQEKPKSLEMVSGVKRKILYYLYDICSARGERISSPVYINQITQFMNVNESTIRKSVQRLIKEGFLIRTGFKSAPGGWTKYEIPNDIYLQISLERKTVSGLSQDCLKTIPEESYISPKTGLKTSPPSTVMYSNNIQDNTILKNNSVPTDPIIKTNFLFPEIREVNLTPLQQWGITPSALDQIERNGWTNIRLDQLEDFIERFVRYFTEEQFKERRSNILNPKKIFFSGVKVIHEGKPDPLSDIKTQIETMAEVAFQNKMKELERRRRDYEAIEKQMEQYLESEYSHWSSQLSNEEKTSIAPTNNIAKLGSVAHNLILKNHFVQNIWPEIKNSLLKSSTSENFNQSTEMSQ